MAYLAAVLAALAIAEAVFLWKFAVGEWRRRALNGNVTPYFKHFAAFPEVAKEVVVAVDLAIAQVVKQSIRSRTVAGITYREGAYDALSVLRKYLNGGKDFEEKKK